MPIQGLRTTANFVNNQRPENWRETILMLYPNSSEIAKAPLTALTSLMKSESVNDPVFHWWEKELDDRRFKLSAAIDGSQTTIGLDSSFKDAKSLKEGDVLLVEDTGEILHVAQDPTASNSIVVVRGAANSSATALNIATDGKNPHLFVIGSGFEEGSMAPTGVNFDPSERSNYTQIFRSTFEMTRTAEKTKLRTGDHVKEAKRECLEYISIDMERAFIFGKKHATTKNGKPLRFTAGVKDQITSLAPSNVTTAPGTVDMEWLEEYMLTVFKFGASEKLAFGGNRALLTFQQILRKNTSWQISGTEKEYGMRVNRITSPFGELVLKTHPLFNQITGGTTGSATYNGLDSALLILDAGNLRYRYIDDLRYEKELTQIGLDGMKSGYIAECGIELHHAKTHFWLNGFKAAAADS